MNIFQGKKNNDALCTLATTENVETESYYIAWTLSPEKNSQACI